MLLPWMNQRHIHPTTPGTRGTVLYFQAPTSYIRMPVEDAVHATWIATLAPEALASWARPRFSASVITNDRPESLQRLLTSLLRSRLFGDEVRHRFVVEKGSLVPRFDGHHVKVKAVLFNQQAFELYVGGIHRIPVFFFFRVFHRSAVTGVRVFVSLVGYAVIRLK